MYVGHIWTHAFKEKKHTTNPSTDDVMVQKLQHGPTEVRRLAVLYETVYCSQQVFNVHTAGQQLLFGCECLLLFFWGGGGGGGGIRRNFEVKILSKQL